MTEILTVFTLTSIKFKYFYSFSFQANVPAISAFYQMRKSGYFYKYALETIINSLGYKGWLSKTAEELVWGYDETLFDLARLTMPDPPELEKFGFFSRKNATSDLATYTMYTGEVNPYNLSKISMYNGKSSLDKWSQPQCNQVQGSDGATFNPYIQKVNLSWSKILLFCPFKASVYCLTTHKWGQEVFFTTTYLMDFISTDYSLSRIV